MAWISQRLCLLAATLLASVACSLTAALACPTYNITCEDVVTTDDERATVIDSWIVNITFGHPAFLPPSNAHWTVECSPDSGLFDTLPEVAWDRLRPSVAALHFRVKAGVSGAVAASVRLHVGSSKSCPATAFTIRVERGSVTHNTPSFRVAGSTTLDVASDARFVVVPKWADRIGEDDNLHSPSTALWFECVLLDPSQRALFSSLPRVDPLSGALSFALEPHAVPITRDIVLAVRLWRGNFSVSCSPLASCPRLQIRQRSSGAQRRPSFAVATQAITLWEDMLHLPKGSKADDGRQPPFEYFAWATAINTTLPVSRFI